MTNSPYPSGVVKNPPCVAIAPACRRGVLALALASALAALSGPVAAEDEFAYRTRRGDTLIGIGGELLQRPADWQRLQRINRVANPRRLAPDAVLKVPVKLLRSEPQQAEVMHAGGDARLDGQPAAVRAPVVAGSTLSTGADGYLTLALPDGSSLTLQPESRLKVESLDRRIRTQIHSSVLRLEQGRVESAVVKQRAAGLPAQQLRTPGAVISVRGTRYRTAAQNAAASRVEVTEGTVGVAGGSGAAVPLQSGYGLIAATGERPRPRVLLPAPDLSQASDVQDRVSFPLRFAAVNGAARYRVQVAAEPEFRDIRAERVVEAPQARIAGLADGDYWMRARAIDADGIEGLDSGARPLHLRARPEPPFPSAPADGSRLRGDKVDFRWSQAAEAKAYVMELAADASFAQPLFQSPPQSQAQASPADALKPGNYFWRVASVQADGKRGPFGDVQRFELRAPPAQPEPPAIDRDKIAFAWPGEPGQRFEFQLAQDADFAKVVEQRQLDAPRTVLERPAAGTYYMRVRATDPDGFVGPFTATQMVQVPSQPWWLLLPLLLIPLL